MKIINKRNKNSKAIQNLGLNYFKKDYNKNKNSRSHKALKIFPKELINNFNRHSDSSGINNSITTSDNYKTEIINEKNKNFNLNNSNLGELYDEEINYDIDTTNKNFHDTTDSSQIKKEKENGNSIENNEISDFNIHNNIHKNSTQKEYWLDEKNRYIQELEKKIQSQEKTINTLSQFKTLYEETISKNNTKKNSAKIEVNFASLENDLNYDYSNKKLLKKLNKEDIRNKTYNDKFENKKINDEADEIKIIKEKKENSKDKYNALYSKYLQLNNDFKYLNNNNQIKFKYEKLLEEYKLLKNKLEEKNKIIVNQQNEINILKNNENPNCKIQYILGGEQEKQVIKNLKQQIEVFRKDLVLSQAMIKSLKSEIAQLNQKNNIASINSINTNINNTNRNNSIDKYLFTFNDNNQNISSTPTPIFKNEKTINYSENPQNLINSLNNKNQLLTKVLEENNQLRNKLKNMDKYFPGFEEVKNYDKIKEEIYNKNIIKKYEEKFKYFNAYIKKVKSIIQKIYEDIPIIINKNTDKNKIENKIISNKFIINLYELRKEYNCIKKIDFYNLDITDDEKCVKIFQNIMKILIEELETIIKYKNNENELNKKFLYDTKKINLKELNIGKNSFIENNISNILIKKDKDKIFDDESLSKTNDKNNIDFISDYKNKGNKNSIKSRQKGVYNFEYGMNADEPEFLEKKYKTIFNNIEI